MLIVATIVLRMRCVNVESRGRGNRQGVSQYQLLLLDIDRARERSERVDGDDPSVHAKLGLRKCRHGDPRRIAAQGRISECGINEQMPRATKEVGRRIGTVIERSDRRAKGNTRETRTSQPIRIVDAVVEIEIDRQGIRRNVVDRQSNAARSRDTGINNDRRIQRGVVQRLSRADRTKLMYNDLCTRPKRAAHAQRTAEEIRFPCEETCRSVDVDCGEIQHLD